MKTVLQIAALSVVFVVLLATFLRGQQPLAPPPVSRHEVFTTASLKYSLVATAVNIDRTQVFVNGLLMLQGVDYTISGKTLTFTQQATDKMVSPIVQIYYWSAS